MKIALCDDDNNDLLQLQQYLENFNTSLSYDSIHSAVDLIEAFKNDFYDLVFMDIEMQPINGLTAAKIIKKKYEKTLIVFTTISRKYSIIGYEVAFRYLVKPLIYENFIQVLRISIWKSSPRNVWIDNHVLPADSIYLVEVFKHNIVVHTQEKKYDLRNSLKNIESILSGCHFIRPHNSYLVNLDYIVNVTQAEIIMKNGMAITISRSRKKQFFEEFSHYIKHC